MENQTRTLPDGQLFINMAGEVKTVARHIALDKQHQKSYNFFVCDAEGKRLDIQAEEEVATTPVKKNVAVADEMKDYEEPIVTIPAGREDIVVTDENTITDTTSGNAGGNTVNPLEDCDDLNEAAAEPAANADNPAQETLTLPAPVAKAAKTPKPKKETKPKAEKK